MTEVIIFLIFINKTKHILIFVDLTDNQHVTSKYTKEFQKSHKKVCVVREKAVILQPQSGNGSGTAMEAADREDGCGSEREQ